MVHTELALGKVDNLLAARTVRFSLSALPNVCTVPKLEQSIRMVYREGETFLAPSTTLLLQGFRVEDAHYLVKR